MFTGRQDLVSYTPTDGVWNPMTGALPSASFKTVRFRVWAGAMQSGVTFAPGVQFSNDGLNWDTAARLEALTSVTADTWNDGKSELTWADLDINDVEDAASTPVTDRLIVRFGLFCKSDSGIKPVQAELEIFDATGPKQATIVTPWTLIHSADDGAYDNVAPLTGALMRSDFDEVRLATDYHTTGTECAYTLIIQEADDPTDPGAWSEGWASSLVSDEEGSVLSSAAWEDFSASVSKPFFRVAVKAKKSSAMANYHSIGRLRARIELRTL